MSKYRTKKPPTILYTFNESTTTKSLKIIESLHMIPSVCFIIDKTKLSLLLLMTVVCSMNTLNKLFSTIYTHGLRHPYIKHGLAGRALSPPSVGRSRIVCLHYKTHYFIC